MTIQYVKQEFQKTIRAMGPPQLTNELKRKLLSEDHERVKYFYENLAKELTKVQAQRARKGKGPASQANIKWLIQQMTFTFVLSIEMEVKLRVESDIARAKRDAAAQLQKDMDSTIAGKPQGIFEEMGIITDEKTLGPERDQNIQEKAR